MRSRFELLGETTRTILSEISLAPERDSTIAIVSIKLERNLEMYVEAARYLVQIYIPRSLRRYLNKLFVVFYKEYDIHFGITFNVYYTFNPLRELIFYWIYNCCEYLVTFIYMFGLIGNFIGIEYFELFFILCGSMLRVVGILRLSLEI